jgi:hypothetical protein
VRADLSGKLVCGDRRVAHVIGDPSRASADSDAVSCLPNRSCDMTLCGGIGACAGALVMGLSSQSLETNS